MSGELIAFASVAILLTAFLSGITGGGGGTLLLGILLLAIDVPTSMVIFGCAMIVGVAARLIFWYRHIDWRVVVNFVPGSLVTIAALWSLTLVPPKWFLFLALGILPFAAKYLPDCRFGNITQFSGATLGAVVITSIQMLAGAAGILLDRLFLQTDLDRKTIVATKSALLIFMHTTRISYFGAIAVSEGISISPELLIVFAAIAVGGTLLATPVLRGMTESAFRRVSEIVISGVSLSFVARGLWMLI